MVNKLLLIILIILFIPLVNAAVDVDYIFKSMNSRDKDSLL